MASLLANLMQDSRGQDMTEYALIGGLMASIAVGIVPEMLAASRHINEVLLSVTQAAADLATLK